MSRYIAFLRAINVGGRRVRMTDLQEHFRALGYGAVETFIASGNVAFEAPGRDAAALEAEIERHLRAVLGYEVDTFLRTPAELCAVAALQPFDADPADGGGEGALMVAFLRSPASEALQRRLLDYRTPTDDFRCHGREVYWLRRTRTNDSAFSGALLERAAGAPATLRNATTVRTLASKYPP